MFGFIKRIFGGGAAVQNNHDPFSRDMPAASSVAPVPPPPVRAAPAIVMQRDEIIDAKTRIAGYRFSARRPDSALQADAASTLEILSANNVAAFAERRIALIPLSSADWVSLNYRPLIGTHTVFLLSLPERDEEAKTWSEVAAMIREAGGKIALAAGAMLSHRELVLGDADFLLLDFPSYSLANLEKMIKGLRVAKPGLQLIADNVGRWPEQRYCIAHGISHCIGSFTTQPDEEQPSGEIGQSRLVLIEMINHLRKEADLADIAEIAKRDPGVVVKVIAMANSPMLGLSQSVTSVDQAIMVLGREQLYRWLSIGLFRAGSTSPRDEVLLEMALGRGRFLEVLGQDKHSKLERDELFLLGLLSLLDCLLGIPMSAVVERVHLSPALKEVLLNNSGPLGRYLLLAIAVEKGSVQNTSRLAEQLGYSLEAVETASLEAIGWAEEATRLSA